MKIMQWTQQQHPDVGMEMVYADVTPTFYEVERLFAIDPQGLSKTGLTKRSVKAMVKILVENSKVQETAILIQLREYDNNRIIILILISRRGIKQGALKLEPFFHRGKREIAQKLCTEHKNKLKIMQWTSIDYKRNS